MIENHTENGIKNIQAAGYNGAHTVLKSWNEIQENQQSAVSSQIEFFLRGCFLCGRKLAVT